MRRAEDDLGKIIVFSGLIALGISTMALPIIMESEGYKKWRDNQRQQNLESKYNKASAKNDEHYISTFNIHSDITGRITNCAFYGIDIDGDGKDDFRRMEVPLGRAMMYHNEYFDFR